MLCRITWDFGDIYTQEQTLVNYAKVVVDMQGAEIVDTARVSFRMLNDFGAVGVYPPNPKDSMRVSDGVSVGYWIFFLN